MLSGDQKGPHKIQGISAGFIPEILDTPASTGSSRSPPTTRSVGRVAPAKEEGLLVGISSGAALRAAGELAADPATAGKTIVVIIPSWGERYLSTRAVRGPAH